MHIICYGDLMNPGTSFSNDPFFSDFDSETIKNFCSFLLNFNSCELPLLSYAISVLLSQTFTIQERTVIGSIFSTIATNTFLIAAQQGFLLQVNNLKSKQSSKRNGEDFEAVIKRINCIEEVLKNNNLI